VKEVKARRPQKADTRIVTISSRQSNHTLCIDENNNIVPLVSNKKTNEQANKQSSTGTNKQASEQTNKKSK